MTLWRRVLEERRSIMLPVLGLIVLSIGLLLLVVLPLQTAVTRSENAERDALMTLANARLHDRQVRNARTSKDRADSELRGFYNSVLPRDYPTARQTINRWLQQAAADAGLVFQDSQFDTTEIRDSRLRRAFSRVTLQGRYQNFRKFLYALETAEEFIIVERVELADSGVTAGTNGTLAISLIASTYYVDSATPDVLPAVSPR